MTVLAKMNFGRKPTDQRTDVGNIGPNQPSAGKFPSPKNAKPFSNRELNQFAKKRQSAEAGEMSTSFVIFSDTLNLPASQDATGMTDGSDFVDLADPISQLSTLVGQSCFFSPNSPESASPTGRS